MSTAQAMVGESTGTAAIGKTKIPKKFHGYFKIPKVDRDQVNKNVLSYCKKDPDNIDSRMWKTAFKATVGMPGCVIADTPEIINAQFGDILLIPIKNTPDPVLISISYLHSALLQRMYV
jgi:hypothetical protein